MKLMIVDDNEQLRAIIRIIVGDLVDQFYECRDGKEAIAFYSEFRPDSTSPMFHSSSV